MLGLIVAGEAIFGLPFHVARFFRKTVLDTFGMDNTDLGSAQAVYGVTAMLSYFPGGPLADRFPARKLLCASLVLTAAGGLYMATFPDLRGSMILWGFYGVSTILLFWAALIRATRDWGGEDEQGRAYGLLDGGRGALAAALALLGVALFGLVFPEGQQPSLDEKKEALRWVIYGYVGATLAAALLVWFGVPDDDYPEAEHDRQETKAEGTRHHVGRVLRMPLVWLQATIILCAYVSFKGFDNYTLYAIEAYGMGEVEAARLASYGALVRPVAALGAGLLADRIRSTRVIMIFFCVLLASNLHLGLFSPQPGVSLILLSNILVASTAIFALRGVYFALFQEANVPTAVTGTAVGIVSVVGYTPDIFVSLLGGILLDRTPGIAGHQHFYLFLASFAAAGLLATLAFMKINPAQAKGSSGP
jgi:nitrate/nitrite transporter NarK